MPASPSASGRCAYAARFAGLFLVTLGLFLGLSLYVDIDLEPAVAAARAPTGLAGYYLAFYTILSLGFWGACLAAALLVAWGVQVTRTGRLLRTWPQVLGAGLFVAGFSVLLGLPGNRAEDPVLCGLVGWFLAPRGIALFGRAGTAALALLAFAAGGQLAFGPWMARTLRFALRALRAAGMGLARTTGRVAGGLAAAHQWIARPPARAAAGTQGARTYAPRATRPAPPEPCDEADDEEEEDAEDKEDEEPEVDETVQTRLSLRRAAPARAPTRRARRPRRRTAQAEDYELPPPELLEEPDTDHGEHPDTLDKRAEVLERTLAEFKIDGKVVGVECGPRVTMFEVALAPGIRVERIFSLANNITMALKAYNVRIVAPIPGKDTVGIEIPNMNDRMVYIRDVYAHYDPERDPLELPMFLGTDLTGAPILSDLAEMPHLLIAGATGSGKSVCINAVLLSFLLSRRPDELKLILVDPKMVELSRFKDIPHLMCPVVTDMRRAAAILEWACTQMDQRYERLALAQVNNIRKFNALGEDELVRRVEEELDEEELEAFPRTMPHIVIVIDELADLMLVAGKDVEKSIIRLASKSRAVGIHVILATQRPSVDVITGLIKANLPSRIAFQVASKVDSRTILDGNGAEALLGAGDMLYLPPHTSKLVRAQGAFASDGELQAVLDHCRRQADPEFHEELEGPVVGGAAADRDADRDELFDEAVRQVLETQRGSVSLLQRKLGIGYGRASRIIDQMAEAGVLGPFRDGKSREILMSLEEYEAAFCQDLPDDEDEADGSLAGLREDETPPDEERLESGD